MLALHSEKATDHPPMKSRKGKLILAIVISVLVIGLFIAKLLQMRTDRCVFVAPTGLCYTQQMVNDDQRRKDACVKEQHLKQEDSWQCGIAR